jgi:hypothetical protein
MAARRKAGRPKRPERVEPTTMLLPRAMRQWLRSRALVEGRSVGRVVERAVAMYAARVTRRKGAAR